MRKINFTALILVTFILISIFSCKSDTIPEEYEYSYNNNYIRDTILYQIKIGTIGNRHLFIINENTLQESEINNKLSPINEDDIISIAIISKSTAIEKYGATAKDGIVKINYYIDPLLKPVYYNTSNSEIMNVINDLIKQNKVVMYPIIVLDGKPLRGTAIKEYLDKLNNSLIKSILTMNLENGLQLYGERAINGVVMIDTL
jgi:hypothetical protein